MVSGIRTSAGKRSQRRRSGLVGGSRSGRGRSAEHIRSRRANAPANPNAPTHPNAPEVAERTRPPIQAPPKSRSERAHPSKRPRSRGANAPTHPNAPEVAERTRHPSERPRSRGANAPTHPNAPEVAERTRPPIQTPPKSRSERARGAGANQQLNRQPVLPIQRATDDSRCLSRERTRTWIWQMRDADRRSLRATSLPDMPSR